MRTKTDTDGHIVGLARRLEQHRRAIDDVIAEVRSSGHPNAEALEQCWFPAWPEHVVRHHLRRPDDWEAATRASGRSSAGSVGALGRV